MSTPNVVEAFYSRIWNAGDYAAIDDLLSHDFSFRGSLGNDVHGHEPFTEYVREVRGALAEYHCEILECVAEKNRAFAKMRFSGLHVGPLRGYAPTGKTVYWVGAALFRLDKDRIAALWVLGDLVGLDALLEQQTA